MFLSVFILVILDCSLAYEPIPGQHVSYHQLRKYPTKRKNVTFLFELETSSVDNMIMDGQSLYLETLVQKTIGSFNRERIPERVVHAKGSTYYGRFVVTNPEISQYTKAEVFSSGKITNVAVRFSTQLGERGSSDTPFGEVRGFGVKFYTKPTNYDLLSINIPVFLVNNPQLFIHLNHAQKRDPRTDMKNGDNLWDFFSLRPETLNAVTFVYSDYGTPDGFSHMPGFSVNAYRLVNRDGKRFYGKFMWLPHQGIRNLNLSEAIRLSGTDPDYARRELFESIENKNFPTWTLYIQVITVEEVDTTFTYNPFDATKIWPLEKYPPIPIGTLTLDRNVENAFAENEQIAFNPANLVAGIEPSPDRLLRGRLFAYRDTQLYRLGANHLLLPVNQHARATFNERDGAQRSEGNLGATPNYYPNSHYLHRPDLYDFVPTPYHFDMDDIFLQKSDSLEQQYQHTRETYYSFTPEQRRNLHSNLAFAFTAINNPKILDRIMSHLYNISPDYGDGVARELIYVRR